MFNFAGKKDINTLDINLNEILSKIERLEEIQKQNSNNNQAKLEAIDNQLLFKNNYEKNFPANIVNY